MCSGSKRLPLVLVAMIFGCIASWADQAVLKIAADPNNLPFSNEKLEGFENKIAALLARDLNMELRYQWRAQRRGFFRETLKDGDCDIVMGAPAEFERALTTRPYYKSSYVFVSRREGGLDVESFDDPRLRNARIGVQLIGDDGVNTPPTHALTERGIITNLVGFTLYGNYAEPNPPARIIESVAKGEVDVAIVWGPLAGYFSKRQSAPLQLRSVAPEATGPQLTFEICIAVRRGKQELRDQLSRALAQHAREIREILAEYGIPTVPTTEESIAK
jgi:mxaJ protein